MGGAIENVEEKEGVKERMCQRGSYSRRVQERKKKKRFFLMPDKVFPTVSLVLIIVQAHYHFLYKIHFFT